MSDEGIRIIPHDPADQATAATVSQIANYLNSAQRDFVRRHGILGVAAAALGGVAASGMEWTEVDYDASPIEVRRVDPVSWSAEAFPERWQETPGLKFPSEAKANQFLQARSERQKVDLLMEAAMALTRDFRALERTKREDAETIAALRDEVEQLRRLTGTSNDNSPALGGQKETT